MNPTIAAKDLDVGGHTDIGKRIKNEDYFLIDHKLGLYVVADGIGGHQCGEVASRLTCEVLQREIAAGATLKDAVSKANAEVLTAAVAGAGEPGMGSTVVAVLMGASRYALAWVGDSRVYLWDGRLSLLTRDHSYVEAQLASGHITPEEARDHPRKNVILQAVGLNGKSELSIGTNSGYLAPGSCLLLCSDGVCDPLDNPQLSRFLARRTASTTTCRQLVDAALRSGGKDNATALLIANAAEATNPHQLAGADTVIWTYDPETNNSGGLPDVAVTGPSADGSTPVEGRPWEPLLSPDVASSSADANTRSPLASRLLLGVGLVLLAVLAWLKSA